MGLLRRRLGAFVAMATLALTPGVRLACLAMCAAPLTVRQAALGAPSADRQPATGAATAHAHRHHHAADTAPPAASTATASAEAVATTRCDAARGSACADAARIVPRPALRLAAADIATAALGPRLATAGVLSRPGPALPPIGVAPPGPPPAPTPLRI